jgi:Zn-dependent M28 family amino/carboxypeptidase
MRHCILAGLLAAAAAPAADFTAALSAINTNDLLRHIRVLASDEFEGRAPDGGRGEQLTVDYLVGEFRRLGLQPGNPDGTFVQSVPLVGIRSEVATTVRRGDAVETWQFPQDIVAWSPRVEPRVEVRDSELVFVGYGVVAPEYGWDDFKGADVRGRTLVMLVGDPPVPDPADPAKLDEQTFRGRAMTYYGRWTYKYEIAAQRGAAAAIIVHETGPAGYPYFVVINSWGRENFDLRTPDKNAGRVAVAAWTSLDRAQRLFADAGLNFAAQKRAALTRDFRPVPLGAQVSFTVTNTLREVTSRNVVAKLPGADPARRDEFVIFTAHWDHLGRDPKLEGDQIYNGAQDNASGVAGLLGLAAAFSKLPEPPARSLLFLAVTAEEQGLLGAKYYAEQPLHPLAKTLANVNMDSLNSFGPRAIAPVVGFGQSTLEDLLAAAAKTQDRAVVPEPDPEKGYYFRSDHFEFAKAGVPALYIGRDADDIRGREPGYGKLRREEYTAKDYHKVSDHIKDFWDLRGAVEDVQLLFRVGYDVANASTWPEWKEGSEFKARRVESLKAGK